MTGALPSSWFDGTRRVVPPQRSAYVWRHPSLAWSFLPPAARKAWVRKARRIGGLALTAIALSGMWASREAGFLSGAIAALAMGFLVLVVGPLMDDWQRRTDALVSRDPQAFLRHAEQWAARRAARALGTRLPPAAPSRTARRPSRL